MKTFFFKYNSKEGGIVYAYEDGETLEEAEKKLFEHHHDIIDIWVEEEVSGRKYF